MKYTRQQIKDNRIKFGLDLQDPEREKATSELESSSNPNARCCLGHGCDGFSLKRTVDEYGCVRYDGENELAPQQLMSLMGMKDNEGMFGTSVVFKVGDGVWTPSSLIALNDNTLLTPQQIGEWLSKPEIIKGGEGTPYLPLSEFPESLG